jgi:hypothetical protein
MNVKLHPLEKVAKQHFGVTDSLEETGYVLSDGTFLDLSRRHIAHGYERRGDRFVPTKRQPDYLYGQRSVDHRELPSEILEAVGTRDGSVAMLAFLRKTGALRLMPGAGFLVAKMPTIESVDRVVREWHHAFGDEPLYVDVVSPGSSPGRASRVINPDDVRESQEFERPTLEAVVEFLESKFGGASMGAARQTPQSVYKFSEMGEEHQDEITGNLGQKLARKTAWELVPDFPVDQAVALTWDTSVTIFDRDVESVKWQIESEGKVTRPILIDALDEESIWMEGRHRSLASEALGLKTIPAFVRVK